MVVQHFRSYFRICLFGACLLYTMRSFADESDAEKVSEGSDVFLGQVVDLKVDEIPFREVIKDIAGRCKFNIAFVESEFVDAGIDLDMPVSASFEGASTGSTGTSILEASLLADASLARRPSVNKKPQRTPLTAKDTSVHCLPPVGNFAVLGHFAGD